MMQLNINAKIQKRLMTHGENILKKMTHDGLYLKTALFGVSVGRIFQIWMNSLKNESVLF